ncbi:hypothetical protein SAMN05421821_106205 [Mucilaginibacter lappiensis]|uniref:Uncharacterized protein n=1 Tax=Mucilaginibacter lappiensis TaxID=354630 RepID=A0ABR6PLC9_9SPHI|nr:hypothetical protein [Mucilaginibacter lappiensis]SIR32779.1 hypothetical protein SAMN05421821_106205 [Mucilaginibacter lappiensis]
MVLTSGLKLKTSGSELPSFKLQNKNPIFAHDKIHDRVWNCQF